MKRVASLSTWMLLLSTLFIFLAPVPQAQAAPCATPTESSFTETGTTYTLQTFSAKSNNCSWTVPSNVNSIRIVIVGGGGGAGFGGCGGGGGAGRVVVSNNAFSVTSGSQITLTVGDSGTGGWAGPTSGYWTMGKNGETSSATINGVTYSASGGGGGAGGTTATVGLNGGSGGGGAAREDSRPPAPPELLLYLRRSAVGVVVATVVFVALSEKITTPSESWTA